MPLCYNIYLNRSVHHTCLSVSSLEWAGQQSLADKQQTKGGIEVLRVTNVFFRKEQYIYIYTDINPSNMLRRYKLLLV